MKYIVVARIAVFLGRTPLALIALLPCTGILLASLFNTITSVLLQYIKCYRVCYQYEYAPDEIPIAVVLLLPRPSDDKEWLGVTTGVSALTRECLTRGGAPGDLLGARVCPAHLSPCGLGEHNYLSDALHYPPAALASFSCSNRDIMAVFQCKCTHGTSEL